MKKGQSEIIGLAIVVILLIMALIFYASFKNTNQSDTQLLRNSIRANNVLNAVLLVNVPSMANKQMKDLLNDCIKSGNCDTEKNELEAIFAKMLNNPNYEFKAFEGDTEKFSISSGVCVNSVSASPARFPDNYRYEFKICYS